MKERLKALTHFQNQVRGAFAALQNKVPPRTKIAGIASERRATTALKDALAQARQQLHGRELERFEQWVEAQHQALHTQNEIGTSRTLLGLVPSSVGRKRLSDALTQTIDSLLRAKEPLESFKHQLQSIDDHLRNERYKESLPAIERASNDYGHSFWAIEAKIAALGSMSKHQAVREYIRELSAGTVGLNSFYLYHIGLRNEVSQSAARLRALVGKRLSDSKLNAEYRAYADFRAARTIPQSREDMAAVLAYEQLTTRIDLLLTAERIAMEIVARRADFDAQEFSLACQILTIFPSHSRLGSDHRLRVPGEVQRAIEEGVRAAIQESPSLEQAGIASLLSLGVAAAVSYSGNEAHEERLKKFLMNYWWLDEAILLDSAGTLPRLPDIFSRQYELVQDPHPIPQAVIAQFEEVRRHSPHLQQICKLDAPPESPPWSQNISTAAVDCIATQTAWQAFDDDEYDVALRVIQFALLHNIRLIASLPLNRMFAGADFDRVRGYGIGVDLCNCLHWYSQLNSERQIRTFKRFAIEEWIEACGQDTVVAAAEATLKTYSSKNLLAFLLSSACDLTVIELLSEVEGTRQALKVRATLLRIAAREGQSAAQLTAEADAIDEQLEVDDVLDDLDETKVSVDEEALLPVVAREISADFDRYKQLLSGSSANVSSLEELLRSLRQQSASTFQIPESEADDLLVQMIQAVLDRFLDDPVYGLDAIIGRRIRHGTISDELRGTLEQMQRIGQRPRTGADYDVPSAVAEYLNRYEPNTRRGATRAFGRFSLAVDTVVAQLRDEVFQCKPKGKLQPAFELPVGVLMFALARDSASTSVTSEQFSRELFGAFWFLLSTYAQRQRVDVKTFTATTLRDACTKLLADLRGSKINDVQFLASVQHASEELQRRAEVISSWVRIPKMSYEGRTYPINVVFDAAMAWCKGRRPGFEPTSTEDIDRTISLDPHGYPIVFDALCIALGNIAQHSGVKQGNRIHTSIRLSDDRSQIYFTIESDLSRDAWSREKAQRVDSIRDEINRRTFADRAKRTSESGLAKLATIVHQRPNCRIDFGATEHNQRFRLYFELAFIPFEESAPAIPAAASA